MEINNWLLHSSSASSYGDGLAGAQDALAGVGAAHVSLQGAAPARGPGTGPRAQQALSHAALGKERVKQAQNLALIIPLTAQPRWPK